MYFLSFFGGFIRGAKPPLFLLYNLWNKWYYTFDMKPGEETVLIVTKQKDGKYLKSYEKS